MALNYKFSIELPPGLMVVKHESGLLRDLRPKIE